MRVGLALVIVVTLIWGFFHFFSKEENPYAPPAEPVIAAPEQYTTQIWDVNLGGDEALGQANWDALNNPDSSDLEKSDALTVAKLAKDLTLADLNGTGREAWPDYWPDASQMPVTCEKPHTVLAASPMKLPVAGPGLYAKVLVVSQGGCIEGVEASAEELNVSYVYSLKQGTVWVPVRSWQIPTTPTVESVPVTGPAEYELKNLAACGADHNTGITARIMVANAWEIMCTDAAADGVELDATSGYRSRAEQQELYKDALSYYGSEKEAKRWVAPADDSTCSSKHCDGTAINVKGAETLSWLNAVVGCSVNGSITLGEKECPDGAIKIKRMQRYGFTSPVPYVPTYLEFTLPVESEKAAADCAPTNSNVPTMVAQIFRCRLQTEGIIGEEQNRIVAEALVVSRCESGWNSLAYAFGGKFSKEPHPVSGKIYDHAGIFMLTEEEAQVLILNGYPQVTNPQANINAAVSLWLTTHDWSSWGCATGHGELFETGPVLPQYGGPDLPAWSYNY